MAKKAAAKRRAKGPAKSSGSSSRLVVLVVMVVLALVATPTALVLAIGMAPSLVALFLENRPGAYTTKCIAACNLAGVLPVLRDLWLGGHLLSQARMLVGDPLVWLQMYGAAGVGWSLVWLAPLVAGVLADAAHDRAIVKLRSRQEKLREEWGDEIGS
ncbi:hypothetical protein P7L78_11850 [Tistrella bauzanensis]|uniref:Uncharacterized protein n=2 Tax=Tistrella TaxID=171436 RepID=A0ABU9YIS1_9PROT|nr:hypothetical protein [Tistrella bauzanensis]GGB28662.1 hypothetical protein GCM10011505_07430 [Tistrella bauzanensis]